MHWKKRGLIFCPNNEHTWMYSHAQVPFSVEFTDFIRVYFATREAYDSDNQCKSYGGFVDLDKNDFSKIIHISDKPAISPGGIGEFDEFGTMPVSVIIINGLYYMYYTGWTRAVSVPHKESIGVAVSDDGREFRKIDLGPLIGESLHEPYVHNCPVVYNIHGKYHMFYTAGVKWMHGSDRLEIQYLIRHAISNDGLKWDMDYRNIIEPVVENECQNSPTIFFLNGKYHMYYCYRYGLDFRNEKGRGYQIGYATSNDLINWERSDSNSGITMSDNGWDSEMICYPSIKKIGEKYYMFYSGNYFGRDGFGYAELIDDNLIAIPGGGY